MEFQYVGPRMRGAHSLFQEWSITPMSSNTYWQPNDVIKLMGNISEGLVDFYHSHFQFTIESQSDVGGIQLDNSAQSLFNQSVVLSRQVEIQRIQQYDVLAAFLSDIGFSQYVCQNRSGQGMGYTNLPTNNPISGIHPQQGQFSASLPDINKPIGVTQNSVYGGYMPTIQSFGPSWSTYNAQDPVIHSANASSNMALSSIGGGNYESIQNIMSFPYDINQVNSLCYRFGRGLGIRAEYNSSILSDVTPSAPWSIPPIAPSVKNQTWLYKDCLTKGYDAGHPYKIDLQLPPDPSIFGTANRTNINYKCGTMGYTRPMTSQYATGGNQPILSSTIPQLSMIEGKYLPQPVPRARKTFRIPFLSSVIGVLVPPDQFQLIPAASVKDIIVQLTLNPYAFFTSGYNDVHEFDRVGMQYMQKREWKILDFQWIWHLYTFSSSDVIKDIDTKLYNGISISSNYWQLVAQYQLPNGSYVRNSFQIPANVESLTQVDIIFLSNQYQTKTFCRKQFRLSNNITSMQFKANGSWYPLQPIIGNGGNPEDVGTSGDNWDFYETLLLNNNFLFNTNVPCPRINQYNFAINGRIYDTSRKDTLLPPQAYNMAQGDPNQMVASLNNAAWKKMNTQTAFGYSMFHQNRAIGKAVYSYTWEPYGHSKGYIHGLDTRGYRQFDVIFNNSPTNVYPGDQTMLIFARSNVVVRYFDGYIEVLGA